MDSLVNLPFDVQMVLVSGFLAYKLATIGRSASYPTEEFILQVIVFGTVARGVSLATELGVGLLPDFGVILAIPIEPGRTICVGLLTVLAGIAVGERWRRRGSKRVSEIMRVSGLYRDDHEHSSLVSILNTEAEWTLVYLHLADGSVLESDFGMVPEGHPSHRITINQDGVALYVTTIFPAPTQSVPEPKAQEQELTDGYGYRLTYVPRDQIKRIELSWRPIVRQAVAYSPTPSPSAVSSTS